jgi:S-adenosylmethionine synthetase
MSAVIISPLQFVDEPVEIVERKGLGHPDTICDAMAETFSRALCREYRNRFGAILHHNVDKALLCGGRAAPAFGGGRSLPRSMSISPVEPFRRLQTTIFRLRRLRLKAQGRG